MTDPVTPLLAYCLWTLALAALTVSGRALLVVTGKARADGFPPYEYDPARFLHRCSRAWLNAVETLPVYATLVFAALYTEQLEAAITPALWIFLARIGQSTIHLVGVNHWLVQLRFAFFLVQLVLMLYLAWTLLTGWLPY